MKLTAPTKRSAQKTDQWELPVSNDNYHAFLVRLWRSSLESTWRVLLQDAVTGQRQNFPSIEGLIAFLLDKVGQSNPPGDATSGKDNSHE